MLLEDYPYTVKYIVDFTEMSERTIQKLTVELVKIVPFFAIKDENNKWRYSKQSFMALALIDIRIVKNSVEMSKYRALEILYGVPIEFSLAIAQKER